MKSPKVVSSIEEFKEGMRKAKIPEFLIEEFIVEISKNEVEKPPHKKKQIEGEVNEK